MGLARRIANFGYKALTNPQAAADSVKRRLGLTSPDVIQVPSVLRQRKVGGPRLVQIMNFGAATRGETYQGNAGDWILITVLRDLFESQAGPLRWDSLSIHRYVGDQELKFLNKSDGVVIGGGGMLLKDTNPNPYSDWQWSCSIDALRKIRVPIAMFAVGYNRFRGQPDFAPIFRDHITLLAEKAVYLGVRNTGSVNAVRGYLPESLKSKVRFQPCMTTLISRIYPELIPEPDAPPRFAAISCALDRKEYRFGDKAEQILEGVAEAAARLSKVLPIKYFSHVKSHKGNDDDFLAYLDRRGVPYELVAMDQCPSIDMIKAYAQPHISIGMRGHSQLVAMGCERPFISLYAHPKLKFLLEDIDALDWGVDLQDDDIADQITNKALHSIENYREVKQRITMAQDRFWEATLVNLRDLARAFRLPGEPELAARVAALKTSTTERGSIRTGA